jgi:hypothetical protein
MPQDNNAIFQDIRNGLYHLSDEVLMGFLGKYPKEADRLRRLLKPRVVVKSTEKVVEKVVENQEVTK